MLFSGSEAFLNKNGPYPFLTPRESGGMKDFFDDPGLLAIDEPLLAAVGVINEPVMIEAEELQYGCLEVVGRDDVFNCPVAELVGGSVGHAPLDSAAGEPGRKALTIVVAAGLRIGSALGDGKPSDLATPVHERRSSSPRCFRSFTKAAAGLSVRRQIAGSAALMLL